MPRIRDGRQVHEYRSVREVFSHRSGQRQGQTRLARARGAYQRYEANIAPRQETPKPVQFAIAPDERS
jgi:hypothetical protein